MRDVGEHAERNRSDLGDEHAIPGAPVVRPRLRLSTSTRARSGWIAAGLLAVLALPLIVALVVLVRRTWYPTFDLALTELRVRDVESSHPPLIGLVGRVGPLSLRGSHPGPLSFWALWPFYRALGASSWAMEAATVALHVVAMATSLWLAFRRGGTRLMIAVAAVLSVLLHAYGPSTLTQAWNPFLPLLFFITFLLAAWSVVDDDLPMLPVMAFTGSFCAQTHVPYLGLTTGLAVFVIAFASWSEYRRRKQRGATRRREARPGIMTSDFALWIAIAAGVAVLVWAPPVLDQIFHTPGNLSVLSDYFRNPPETPVGLRPALDVWLVHLNPWQLIRPLGTADQSDQSVVPGVLFLGAWAASVLIAWRIRHRALLRLDLVLAVAVGLALVSMSRIFGIVWYYLVLWAWGITALMALAVVWTAVVYLRRRLGRMTGARMSTIAVGVLVGIVVLFSALAAADATRVDFPLPRSSETLSVLVPPTVDALDEPSAPGGGPDGRYLVTGTDPAGAGATGFGLLNELDRRGFDVGMIAALGPEATRYHVRDPADATGVVHLATGFADIAAWRAKPGVREVARTDPRTPLEQAEFSRLRAEVIYDLNAAGLPELGRTVDVNLFRLGNNRRVPALTRLKLARMMTLGLKEAVFIGPREVVG
jgi:uncharacterized membrane protein